MQSVDELLESLEAISRQTLDPSGDADGQVEGSLALDNSLEEDLTLRDYFSDETSIDVDSSHVQEVVEALKLEKRKFRRLSQDVLHLRRQFERERSARLAAEAREKALRKEREISARTVDSLVALLRDANEILNGQSRMMPELTNDDDYGLNIESPEKSVQRELESSREESRLMRLAVKELEDLLHARSRELELSDARRRASELELAALKSEVAAQRLGTDC